MPCDGKIIGGLWYVDQDDAEHRLEAGKLWRKLDVRLAGTLGPKRKAALVHLRGWWEQWHSGDEYQAESAMDEFEREVLSAYDLEGIGWERKELDSWNGGLGDGVVLIAKKNWGDKTGLASIEDLAAVAQFLDRIGRTYWIFLPDEMEKWIDLPKNMEAWANYGDGGSEELLDRLRSREQMAQWAEDQRQAVWKKFRGKVAEKWGEKWVREWCDRKGNGLNVDEPCENLLRELKAEAKRRFWRRVLRRGMAVLGCIVLLGAGICMWEQYLQEVQLFESYQQRLEKVGNGELEKLTELESDLKAASGGAFLGKQWKSLRFEVMNRLDEELDEHKCEVEQLRKRGQYLDAAKTCARIGACLRQRGEASSDWAEKESRCRMQENELAEHVAQVETLLNARDYAAARSKLNDFDQMVAGESRQQQIKAMRERVNLEPRFWKQWEGIQKQAAPDNNPEGWRGALEKLNKLVTDMESHPAVVLPAAEEIEKQRNVLDKRLETWNQVNKRYEETRVLIKQTPTEDTPEARRVRKQLRETVIENLKWCLDKLDALYDENGGQPCGGAEMDNLYNSINKALNIMLQKN